jgi:hypothetical protein
MDMEAGEGWVPGPIGPKPVRRTVSVSVRMPAELHAELGRYAKQLGAPLSYLIVECVRRLVESYRTPESPRAAAAKQPAGAKRPPRPSR